MSRRCWLQHVQSGSSKRAMMIPQSHAPSRKHFRFLYWVNLVLSCALLICWCYVYWAREGGLSENASNVTFDQVLSPYSTIYIPIPPPVSQNTTPIVQTFDFQNQRYYLLNASTYPVHLLVPPHLQKASDQALDHPYCEWIINGGPFHSDGSPAGGLIWNGTSIEPPKHDNDIGFGIQQQHDRASRNNLRLHYVMGNFPTHNKNSSIDPFMFSFWVSGFDWIVHRGNNVANTSRRPPFVARAPRTALGIDAHGYLVALVADGCEKWWVVPSTGDLLVDSVLEVVGTSNDTSLTRVLSIVLVPSLNTEVQR